MFDVICNNINGVKDLTIGRKYTVIKEVSTIHRSNRERKIYFVINDSNLEQKYTSKRFVTLLEFRNIRISKLLEK